MQNNPQARAALGCGYEVPRPGARTWTPHGLDSNYQHTLTVCPGYTTALPEVIETARARIHWNKSSLRDFCGDQPTDETLACIEVLEASCNELLTWAQQNPEKK